MSKKNIITNLENLVGKRFNLKTLKAEIKTKFGVDVEIDNNLKFKALVKKDYAEKPTGYVYTISKGTHSIIVSYNGTKLYSNQIFVSPQETKKIVLQ
jgi:hypothetical protein